MAAVVAAVGLLAQPAPQRAEANPICDVASGGPVGDVADAVTGGIGLGNPIGDACDAVSGAVTAPLDAAVESIGGGVFNQLTSWVSEGAGWLIGRVVVAIDKTTTPQLATKGFLRQYTKMAAIAAVMAAAMLMLAVLEGLAQGNSTLLVRVALVNAPLALIATTIAYAVVQLLLVVTDGLCAAVSATSDEGGRRFFEAAIGGLGEAGGNAGKEVGAASGPAGELAGQAGGAAGAPLFVAFLAAIVGAFAAFVVWLELLMRDAAVYVVALFLPLSLAASIWPRWTGALRRTAELLVAVVASKFVIVVTVNLAAALIAGGEGGIEHVLAASALMLLACFAPFVLLKLIPFAEGAMSAAYARRSASSSAMMSGAQVASNVAILRGMASARRGDSGVTLWDDESGGGGGAGRGKGPGGGRNGGGGSPTGGGGPRGAGASSGGGGVAGGAGAGGAGAGSGAGAGGAAAAVPVAVGRGAKGTAVRLSQTAAAKQPADDATSSGRSGDASQQSGARESGGSPGAGERPPRPKEAPRRKPQGGQASS
jgi:DNA processing protein